MEVTVKEANKDLPGLIDAAVRGEDVVITKDGDYMVRLVPVKRAKPKPQFGSAKGLIMMSDDFDAPLPDFDEYTR